MSKKKSNNNKDNQKALNTQVSFIVSMEALKENKIDFDEWHKELSVCIYNYYEGKGYSGLI